MSHTPCSNCPHRKRSEGGLIPDGEKPKVKLPDGVTVHPCNLNWRVDCRGWLRDLEDNISKVNNDTVCVSLDDKILPFMKERKFPLTPA